ncbi:MAG: carbohydrate kinase family protein [Candidatus Peribacteraceae bacterium]|jgi:adenosine kinase|nr:carbohydrate kinase family protein [Candidatus Peribacteraceae bacterium]
MKRILITGSIAYDILLGYEGSFADAIDPKSLQHLSLSFFSPRFARHHGGTAANIAWNLRLLGGDPLIVGTVGSDGGSYKALLSERGIDVTYIGEHKEHVTATAIIGTDLDERQITFFHPGADAVGSWPDLSDERDDIVYGIVSPRDTRQMTSGMLWCEQQKVPVFFDPGQQIIAFSADELRRFTEMSAGVIVNDYEWSLLKTALKVNEKTILNLTPLVIVTHGEKGVSLFTKEGHVSLPACTSDQVVDPTGAGDAFRGGFLFGLARGWDTETACKLGAAMGSKVVEQEGTLLNRLDCEEVWLRAERAYGHALPK